jgi:hypothetical protein
VLRLKTMKAASPLSASRSWTSVLSLAGLAAASTLIGNEARAQCETFGPLAAGFRVSQSSFYDQIWSQMTRTQSGFVSVWSEGQDIVLRRYDTNLAPLSNDTYVNTTLNLETQDEPAVATATGGNFLIAWSERHGYDGEQMGIYGRVYNAAAVPLATEFRLNQIWQASQWRPLIAPTPSGGFVVAWSGNWDGDSFLRIFDASGSPLTNDVLINQFTNDAQVDPAVAAAANGTIFAVFVDFSSHSAIGSGLDLYGRLFSATGAPLGDEFLLTSNAYTFGDQRLPRIATDASNHFVVVWTSESVDGSGYAVVGKRFDSTGAAIGSEFQVNTTTASDQTEPRVACAADGDFVVSWTDYSTGSGRIKCRRFTSAAIPKGGENLVHDNAAPTNLAEISMNAAGTDVVFAYDVDNGTDYDVLARRFVETAGPQIYCSAKSNSAGCTPAIAFNGSPSASGTGSFNVTATNVINQKSGLLFYGFTSSFTPFQGGTLCVVGPRRTQIQFSGGTVSGHNCSGSFSYDFNARVRSGVDPELVAGQTISAQYYYRDALDPAGFGTGLTDAVRFTLCP